MKSCNIQKRGSKRKIFKLIKKPAVAEEFFPNLQAIGEPPFFSDTVHGFLHAGPTIYPQCFSVAETFIVKEMTQT